MHSAFKVTLVLVEDYLTGNASWMTPSAAARLATYSQQYCQVETDNPRYQVLLKAAGPMPEILISSTENYKEE